MTSLRLTLAIAAAVTLAADASGQPPEGLVPPTYAEPVPTAGGELPTPPPRFASKLPLLPDDQRAVAERILAARGDVTVRGRAVA